MGIKNDIFNFSLKPGKWGTKRKILVSLATLYVCFRNWTKNEEVVSQNVPARIARECQFRHLNGNKMAKIQYFLMEPFSCDYVV